MNLENLPVEVISNCDVQGKILPIKLRYEAEDYTICVSRITSVLYAQENNFAGNKTFDYCCRVMFEEREHLIELRYFIITHKWVIKKVLC